MVRPDAGRGLYRPGLFPGELEEGVGGTNSVDVSCVRWFSIARRFARVRFNLKSGVSPIFVAYGTSRKVAATEYPSFVLTM